MPATATPEMVFLFEDEVREAGRRLDAVRALRADCTDEDAVGDAICAALNACMAALAGAEKDDACLLLTSKLALGLRPNVAGKRPVLGSA